MPHSMKFYHDQLIAAGKSSALHPAHRLLYVRHGSVLANGESLAQDQTAYFGGTLELSSGSSWLFRLDSITSAAGRVTPRHRHHGPGIRVLYQGTFNVQDASHATEDIQPGQPWWESGADTVMAWHSIQMPAVFIQGMILPTELEGTISNVWLSDTPATQANWRLFIDQEIVV